jgi:hypothetical protein
MASLNEVLHELTNELHWHRRVMVDQYQKAQIAQATETAGQANAYTMNLLNPVSPTPVALMIIPRNDRRKELILINNGPSDILYDMSTFDPLSIMGQISDAADPSVNFSAPPNSMINVGFLKSGQQLLYKASPAIWAYALGATQGSPTGATLSMLETVYNVASFRPNPGERVDQAGLDYGGKATPHYAADAYVSNVPIP